MQSERSEILLLLLVAERTKQQKQSLHGLHFTVERTTNSWHAIACILCHLDQSALQWQPSGVRHSVQQLTSGVFIQLGGLQCRRM